MTAHQFTDKDISLIKSKVLDLIKHIEKDENYLFVSSWIAAIILSVEELQKITCFIQQSKKSRIRVSLSPLPNELRELPRLAQHLILREREKLESQVKINTAPAASRW